MATNSTRRRTLVVPLLAMAAVALPLGLPGNAGVTEACAQFPSSGSCAWSDNICVFINGVPYPGTWEGS